MYADHVLDRAIYQETSRPPCTKRIVAPGTCCCGGIGRFSAMLHHTFSYSMSVTQMRSVSHTAPESSRRHTDTSPSAPFVSCLFGRETGDHSASAAGVATASGPMSLHPRLHRACERSSRAAPYTSPSRSSSHFSCQSSLRAWNDSGAGRHCLRQQKTRRKTGRDQDHSCQDDIPLVKWSSTVETDVKRCQNSLETRTLTP